MNNGRLEIGSVGFVYKGSGEDVEQFLFAIVRDYFNTFRMENGQPKQLPVSTVEGGGSDVIPEIG